MEQGRSHMPRLHSYEAGARLLAGFAWNLAYAALPFELYSEMLGKALCLDFEVTFKADK